MPAPRRNEHEKQNAKLSIRLSPATLTRLRIESKANNCTMGELVRRSIEQTLEQ